MLSIRDCLDYCDLTDEDVAIIAEHHDIPEAAAVPRPCTHQISVVFHGERFSTLRT